MTREELLTMIRSVADADKVDVLDSDLYWLTITLEELDRFAALIADREREECAKLCMGIKDDPSIPDMVAAKRCIEAIRARSNPVREGA